MKKILIVLTLCVLPAFAFAHETSNTHPHPDTSALEASITNANQTLQSNTGRGRSARSSAATITAAKNRKEQFKELAKKNPQAALRLAFRPEKRAALPTDLQQYIESNVTVTAKVNVLHIDDFKTPENSYFTYTLKASTGDVALYPTREVNVRSGTVLKVNGVQVDNVLVATGDDSGVIVTQAAPIPTSIGDQKTAVLLVDFTDSGNRPFTAAQVKDLVFNDQFQKLFKEQSYDKISFSGDVFGWYRMPRSANLQQYYPVCGGLTDAEVAKLVADNGIKLENYKRLVIIPYHPSMGGGCSSVGEWAMQVNGSTYNLSQAWIGSLQYAHVQDTSVSFPWDYFEYVLAHELGHSIGVLHANSWECGSAVLYGDTCSHVEYGNSFDTMGTGSFSLHFNAFYKEYLGWFNSSDALTITGSGNYTINPLELASSSKKYAKLVIPGSTDAPYYLEFRNGSGFDGKLNTSYLALNKNGLLINNIIRYDYIDSIPMSRLLAVSPTDDYGTRYSLRPGKTFSDPDRGIAISTATSSSSGINFSVNYSAPVCTQRAPIYNSSYYQDIGNAGDYGYMSMNITNQTNGCGPVLYTTVPHLPDGWITVTDTDTSGKGYDLHPQVTLMPGQSDFLNMVYLIPETTPSGTYKVSMDVMNAASGAKKTVSTDVRVNGNVQIGVNVKKNELNLQYDSANKESALIGNMVVEIIGGDSDVTIPPYAFNMYADSPEGAIMNVASIILQGSGVRLDPNLGVYIVPARATSTFTIQANFPLKTMFAGTYKAHLHEVWYNDSKSKQANPNESNPVTIIGEVSPYITNITSPIATNLQATISGSRFEPTSKVIFIDTQKLQPSITAMLPSTNGNQINFIPGNSGVVPGVYQVQIINDVTGGSNNVLLEVKTSTRPDYRPPRPTYRPAGRVQGISTNFLDVLLAPLTNFFYSMVSTTSSQ
ncbi:MAG: hypothetical protein K0S38_622 [Candidatus Paceibacter sp.]|jgi:M6 family metalloprotease-like protein|nr:hypothetical protein [Candidatus Paceibacter sp.]